MEQKTKAAILHEIIRKFASGGKDITPHDWRAFVDAQNDGYRTGPEIGAKIPIRDKRSLPIRLLATIRATEAQLERAA